MNTLLDLRWMAIGEAGGMEQLAYELVNALARVADGDRFYIYCPKETYSEFRLDSSADFELLDSETTRLIPERVSYERDFGLAGARSRTMGIAPKIPGDRAFSIIDVDVIHSIGGFVSEEFHAYRNMATILDLQHRHLSQCFSKEEIEARELNHSRAIKLCDRIACISDFVREDVLRQYHARPENVVTIWPTPSSHAWLDAPRGVIRKELGRLGISGEYIFFPAHGWPHKNHIALIDAFIAIRKSFPRLSLALTGGKFGRDHPAARRIAEEGLEDAVVHLGYRTPIEVHCLLKGAKALVFPSKFEGFGLPVAEAIIAGTPVVCSNIPALLEIAGEAASTFDPDDPEDLANALSKVLGDASVADALRDKASERRRIFHPDAAGLNTWNEYRGLLGLDRIESKLGPETLESLPDVRFEEARSWLRLASARLVNGDYARAVIPLMRTAVRSPRLAWMALRQAIRRKPEARRSFYGRYGDGWLGPVHYTWLMVPDGAERLSLDFEPSDKAPNATVSVSINEGQATIASFAGGRKMTISVSLPIDAGKLVSLRVESGETFIPKQEGSSPDERELSVKLLEMDWE